MKYEIKRDTTEIDWSQVNQLLKNFGLVNELPEKTKAAFEHSQEVVFLLEDEQIIGCGRALSDYVSQAAIYNIAIATEYQSMGLGTLVVETLVEAVKDCNITLYTHPDTIKWYKKLGFEQMKSGMAIFHLSHREELYQMGFF
ncbi:GNAT family N-acetyltransferase [Enterococcus dongliensis]|uniref:GNAT family N-acetyltransferase n=1 Tax=Enterococcus dongliensis TaxID=2559925 RepID=UPI00288FCE3B|nr:GNAT family N-acetyltransferase [Enterococcus dongliensis]MDT2612475.1 GNAT family N-acetyltransferase [Enterococcus dongliensis]